MIDEVGAGLPPHWLLLELAEVAVLVRGVSYKKEDAANVPSKDLVPVLRATNITGSGLTFDSLVYVPARYVSETQYIRKGDIVIASSSGSKEVVGKSGQVPNDPVEASFGAFCTLIRPEAEMDDGYLGLYFQSPAYREAISEISAGSNINNIKSSELNVHRVPVPPRAEQTRIVEKLEELLSDLDAGVAELKAAQRKLAQYRQSLLKAAVEGALTADWRAARARSGEPQETGADLLQRILTERRTRWEEGQLAAFSTEGRKPPKDWRRKYKEPGTPATDGQMSIPSHWVWAGIEQVADGTRHALKAGPFGSALKKEFYTPTGYKVYGQEQVIRGDAHFGDYFISQAKFDELSTCAVKPGDLLISLVGTTGKILVLPDDAKPGIINPRLLKVSLALGSTDPAYIQLVLESPYARHFFKLNAHGGTMDVLNLGILKEFAIPIPPLAEQHEIAQRIRTFFEAIECQAAEIEHALKQAAAQRKNILKAAFAGQLVPKDPNDEPASTLLERIRAERAMQATEKKPRQRQRKEAP